MRLLQIGGILLVAFLASSCKGLVGDINDISPNKPSSVTGDLLFRGIQIADVTCQFGLQCLIGAVWSGHLRGNGHNFTTFQKYEYTTRSSDSHWSTTYQGVVAQAKTLRSGISIPNKCFFYGASSVVEANAIGTASAIYGNVPYSEAFSSIKTPKYDEQKEVLKALQTLIDKAVTSLTDSKAAKGIDTDLFFGGNSAHWIKAAYTLKSRLYLESGYYTEVIKNCKLGISEAKGTMNYQPPNVLGSNDINIIHATVNGSQKGLIDVVGTHLRTLLLPGASSRNNTKTNESSRVSYYYAGDENTQVNLDGIAAAGASMPLISMEENLLNWAEATVRMGMFDEALSKLNTHRKNLREGVYFTVNGTAKYEDYVSSDFEKGGLENIDNIDKKDALLREIIEERYATFFCRMLAFNDVRRYRKDKKIVQVSIPFNAGSKYPERFLYPSQEFNANPNVPKEKVGLFDKTPLNQ